MSYYKNRVVKFPKDKKELLDLKTDREITELEQNGFLFLSLAKDFAGIINYGNFSEVEIDKMLAENKLVQKLVEIWEDSDEVMSLQEKFLENYLN